MCGPMIAMGLTGVGGMMQAWGQYQSGKYSEQVAKNNALTQQWMAESARARGARAEERERMRTGLLMGQQRAAAAASGRSFGGSVGRLMGDTAMMGELDALMLRSNAELEAYGHERAAADYREQGRLARRRGTQGAIGTLLTAGASVGGQWASSGLAMPWSSPARADLSGPVAAGARSRRF